MEIKYQLFEEENLLAQKFTGLFSIELYMRYSGYIMQKSASKSIKKILIDFREIEFQNMLEDFDDKVEKMIEIRKKIFEKDKKRENVTIVFWVDKPLPTVIAQIFQTNFSNIDYNYCSTTENILEFLKLPEHFNNLEKIVNNLENSY